MELSQEEKLAYKKVFLKAPPGTTHIHSCILNSDDGSIDERCFEKWIKTRSKKTITIFNFVDGKWVFYIKAYSNEVSLLSLRVDWQSVAKTPLNKKQGALL